MKLSNQDFEYLETVYNIVYDFEKKQFFQNENQIDESEVMMILSMDEDDDCSFEKFTNRGKSKLDY